MTNETQNFITPPDGSLFSPVESPLGLRLALVFGNEGPDGRCPFYGQQCMHCDLGAGEGVRFTSQMNCQRLDFLKKHYADVLDSICHLVIYNYGSTFNDIEFSSETRTMIMRFASSHATVSRISFDSREHFITAEKIATMTDLLRPDQRLSITLGLESQDDEIRMNNLKKQMTREMINEVFAALATRKKQTAVEMNVLFQPPGITGPEAIEESIKSIEYGLSLMDHHGVLVDFNFHPYYPSVKGTRSYPDHPRAMLEHATSALIRIIRIIKAHGGGSSIFVGWNDEGHDLQPTVRKMKQMLYDPAFASFNRSQNECDLQI